MSAAALLAAIVIGFAVIYPASAQVPPSRALFLDLDTVFTQSAVGKSIRVQLEQFLSEIADREKATVAAFEERERTLIVSAQDRPRDELQADWSQLQAERTGQADLYRLERTAVQASSNNARRRVNAVLNEIMQEILVERGANMVLAVTAVHVGGVDYDITAEIIARLDKRLPSLTVERPK
ncbi:MAG: OmpH family outer membrane protein [Candidatus Phaeomarinobacter sp.]